MKDLTEKPLQILSEAVDAYTAGVHKWMKIYPGN